MKKLVFTLLLSLFAFTSINAQKVEMKKVFGGYTFSQNNKALSVAQLTDLMKNNKKAFDLMKSAKTNQTWSTILGGVGGGLIGYPIGTAIGGGDAKWELAGVGAALVLVAIPIANGFNKKATKAVDLYNEGLPAISSNFNPTFNFNFKGTSMGISMNF